MAKRSTKFGTFGGVFTPSILTILGVIMYLRLPWVVGNAGLWVALGVIAAAHLISVTTGLSISSIATDKKVGAGGPYYIVSRSLGLPIGGTLLAPPRGRGVEAWNSCVLAWRHDNGSRASTSQWLCRLSRDRGA
jgi:amino acid transporter